MVLGQATPYAVLNSQTVMLGHSPPGIRDSGSNMCRLYVGSTTVGIELEFLGVIRHLILPYTTVG